MDKYGYRLKKNTTEPKTEKRYHKTDLMQMTTFQLREICRREKLIQGIIDPMDWCCPITENLQEPMLLSWAEMGVCVP